MTSLRANCCSILAWLALLLALPSRMAAQATLTTLFTNGPAANRINIVLLSEGYTAAQLSTFTNFPGQADAVKIVAALLSTPPYSEYSNYFNAYAISVASTESGSDHPNSSTVKNTYFNSSYDSGNEIITIPPNQFDSNYNDGKGKIRNLLTNLMPQYDFVILVVNDFTYGGSGDPPDVTTNLGLAIVSLHFSYPELIAHESGHGLAGLADEYAIGGLEGVALKERPNATTSNTLAGIRWKAWISNSVPIPTPDDPTNYDSVGLFQGAQYNPTGWYRPQHDCIMRSVNLAGSPAPFCTVCTEAVIKSIYSNNLTMKRLRLIDSYSPVATNFTLAAPAGFTFSLTNLQPATHSLSVQWYTNNTAVAGATASTFSLPGNYPNGTLNVRAIVRDLTPLVRNDPANLLSNSVAWTVNVAQSSLKLANPRWINPNQFAFTVTGTAPLGFNIQASTNFSTWTNLAFGSLTSGNFNYTNTGITNLFHFYRAIVTNTP